MTNTYTYPFVEDYIDVIAGYKTPAGKSKYSIFQPTEPLISLARYDVKVVDSFAEQSRTNVAYTDKQASLAIALILKYERQLAKHQIDIAPIKTTPKFRVPLRTIDRTSRVWIEDDRIKIKFPYNTEHIDSIRNESKESRGSIAWNHDKKVWEADLTEYTTNWVYTFSKQHGFEIDSSVQEAMNLILAVETQPYAIELQAATDALMITNASNSLLEYVNENLGGFSFDNLLKLSDSAPILGYTINPVIAEVVIESYGTRFWSLCINKDLKMDLSNAMQDQVQEIVDYATVTNRFPIHVYEPDMSDRLAMLFIRKFAKEQIVDLDAKQSVTSDTKLVLARKIPKTYTPAIPLLISSAGMMFGGDKQLWLQSAEKVVYFTKEVYNKKNKKGQAVATI
jgi:hypothetical protein